MFSFFTSACLICKASNDGGLNAAAQKPDRYRFPNDQGIEFFKLKSRLASQENLIQGKMMKNSPVILVDDDNDDLDLLKELIARIDSRQQVITFNKGEDVLNYLRTTKDNPLIIITDVNMPGMNGIELREAIYYEEQLRLKSIPYIFYSTSVEKEAVKKAYSLTVQGFFKKEASVKEIESTLRELFHYWKRCVHPNSFK